MTAAQPNAASPEVTPLPFDRKAWEAWLINHTDPQWRSEEWNQEYWLFTGDPDEEATAIWRCWRTGCHVAARASRYLCRSCYEQWLQSGLSREEFAKIDRALVRALPGSRPQCAAVKGTARCPREATTLGGCTAHYSRWKSQTNAGKTSLPFTEWLADADPFPPSEPCMIAACDGLAALRVGLCSYHGLRWRRHCQGNGMANASRRDLVAWAATGTPRLNGYQFSLMPLNPLLRREVLYGLAQRDIHRPTLNPVAGRLLVRGLAGVDSLVTLADERLGDYGYLDRNCEAHWRDVLRLVRAGFDEFRGVGPMDKATWELTEIGLTSRTQSGLRLLAGQVDSTQIRQVWLRRLLADWVKEVSPDTTVFRRTFEGCRTASEALERRPGGGHDPAALKVTDMDAIVEAIKQRRRKDGGELGYSTKAEYLRSFCQLLDFGRRVEIVGSLASGFARQSHHKIPHEDPGEDKAGKAIPEFVIAQLDAALDRIGVDFVYGKHDPAAVQLMLQTVYILLRDTGRRPWEIRWLRTDCLEEDNGEYVLIWDNKKSRRKRRRLEIGRDTAYAIQRWLKTRSTLQVPAPSRSFLFPAASRHAYDACIDSDAVGRMLRRWVDDLPELHSDVLDTDGLGNRFRMGGPAIRGNPGLGGDEDIRSRTRLGRGAHSFGAHAAQRQPQPLFREHHR
jgi:integrase